MIYPFTLKSPYLQGLSDIVEIIRKDEPIADDLKVRFSAFARDTYDMSGERESGRFSRQIWKAFNGHPVKDGAFNALFFEFLSHLADLQDDHKSKTLTEALADFRILRDDFLSDLRSAENPFFSLAMDLDADDTCDDIPDNLTDTFIGYRRSTNASEIIRFHFEISQPDGKKSGFLRYSNQYRRGDERWNVTGGGFFSRDNTLHLVGHARDSDGKESRGYRTLALRAVPFTDFLCGPVLSMDKSGPIAARILLIPLKHHALTAEQKDRQKEGEQHLIDHLVDMSASHSSKEYLAEIEANVGHLFGPFGIEQLFQYISNLTTSTVKSFPELYDPTTSRLLKADVQLRRLCHQDGARDYADELATAMEERIKQLEG